MSNYFQECDCILKVKLARYTAHHTSLIFNFLCRHRFNSFNKIHRSYDTICA